MVQNGVSRYFDERHVGMISRRAFLQLLKEKLITRNALHRHNEKTLRVRQEEKDGRSAPFRGRQDSSCMRCKS